MIKIVILKPERSGTSRRKNEASQLKNKTGVSVNE